MVSFSHQEREHIRWDVLASASSVPNIHDKSAKPAGLRSVVMRLARIHIVAFLLTLGFCNAEAIGNRGIKVNDSADVERSVVDDIDGGASKTDTESLEEEQDEVEASLPTILPPIILLDFDNATDDNATVDEKSKRTVNDGLGYGFGRNSLVSPRKYNYYFPAGKTGTTVSIEESISPFLPTTIIEKVQSNGRQHISDSNESNPRQQGAYRTDGLAFSFQNHANYRYYNPTTKSPPVYGLRTKLTKTTNSESYRGFSTTARPVIENARYSNVKYRYNGASTTPQPFTSTETASYVTPNPQSYTISNANRYTYFTPSIPPSYSVTHSRGYLPQGSRNSPQVQGYSGPTRNTADSSTSTPLNAFLENISVQSRANPHGYVRADSNVMETSAPEPVSASGYEENAGPFADLPRYTVENGVRYENKIFWKYPDGRVSDVPPMAYETYSYPSLAELPAAKTQETQAPSAYESTPTENSVLSQGPVQFPMVPETPGPPSPFISAESLSRTSQQQVYRLGYQNLVSQKQIVPVQQTKAGSRLSPTYSISPTPPPSAPRSHPKATGKSQKDRYDLLRQTTSKYTVNSPDAEYADSYTTESTPRSTTSKGPFTSSAGANPPRKSNAATADKNLENYSNLRYSDLLNYNPSISQYIKNPASILNVRPTFVQAGSSLIPVIILRVDGVPPIQTKTTPNVNLKALLQRYLVQYANSVEELTRSSSDYNFNDDRVAKNRNTFSASSLRELAQLAPRHDDQDLIGNPTESYVGKSSYETSNLDVEKSFPNGKYGQRTAARPKVKSVQIIEDPRFTNYNDKN